MSNNGYEILDHPSDILIRATGYSREELFLSALKGMNEVLKPVSLKGSISRIIAVNSFDSDSLLVDFLNEALYSIQTNKETYNDVYFSRFGENELEARLRGNKVERFNEDIKAVTYHDLKIEKKEGRYQATILFDI